MKKVLRLLTVLGLLLGVNLTLSAQDRTVTGRVTSAEDGSPIPGANVLVKGSATGSTTGADGRYSLSVPANATLVFSFIGLESQEVAVGNRSVIDVQLASGIRELSEVVVVGYGVQDKRTLTSSISTIKGDALSNLTTPSFDQQLAGRAAGVQVTVGSGVLGQAPRIRIRGTNSISSGSDPLVVIDGIPMVTGNQSGVTPTNPLGDVNPNDIESFEVLKDGAATAIYGSRAAGGVILITTKKGRKNSPMRVNFDAQYGITNVISRFDLLNAREFVDIANEKISNQNATLPAQAFLDANNTDTDWQDEIFRTGTAQTYNMSFGGGSESTNYYFSLGYTNQKGAIAANNMNRLSFLTNLDHNINKWITVGTKVQVSRTSNDGLNTGTNALSGNVTNAARLLPNVPVYNPDHPTGYNISPDNSVLGSGANTRNIDNNYTNIRFILDNNQLRANTNRILNNNYVQLNLLKGLNLRTQYGIDYTGLRDLLSWDPRHGDGRGSNGIISRTSREVVRWNWQNLLNYNADLGKNTIGVTLGTEYQKTNISSFSAGGSNFSDRYFLEEGLITGTYATQTSSGTFIPKGFDSYFGRINYGYDDRYLLSFSIRNDGLSALPKANRRGTFMGGSVGYRVSEEEFYKNSGLVKYVNDIKLRASYAEVGNDDIGFFPYLGVFGSAQYASQNGIGFSQAGNPDLRWESSKKINFGIDLGLLSNRITASVDYFRNNVDDLILAAPTPSSLGIPGNSINRNIGSMVNQGVELELNADVISSDKFRWSVSANYTALQNEILSLNKGADGKDQDILQIYHVGRVGQPAPVLYGFEYAGVNPQNGNPLFVKGNGSLVQRNVANGTYSFYDVNDKGNTTNTQGAALSFADVSAGGDRKVLGNTNPTWFGGFTNSFSYSGIDLEIFSRFSGGNKIMNVTRQETLLNQDFNNNSREILNRWTREGQVTDVPRLYINNTGIINLTGTANSRFIESGDFFRIQNIILGYTLPAGLLNKGSFPVRSVRIFGQVQNAFTFTRYSGLDPELNSDTGNLSFGLDFNTNPQLRTFTFGLNIGL